MISFPPPRTLETTRDAAAWPRYLPSMTDYDSPATFRGQLHRGRGIAVQRATTEPDAAEAVYECVFEDMRWDLPCDERDSYLAGLIHRLQLPLGPIERRLATAEDSESVEHTLGILALLPFVGRADAAALLERYAVEGRYRQLALEAIGCSGVFKLPRLWDGLADAVAAAYDDDQLGEAISYYRGDPWPRLAESQPRIRRLLDEVTAARKAKLQPGPGVEYREQQQSAEASLEALIQDVATGGQKRAHALSELGRRGEHRVIDLAEEICWDDPSARIPGMAKALDYLGPTAVPRARVWSASDNRTLAHLATRVLAEHGDSSDTGTLHAALKDYIARGEWCTAETPARGLGRLGARDAANDLMAAWENTPHSLARVTFLQALIGCCAPWAEACAKEGLLDCQPEVRQLACEEAPDSAGVRQRLREIARDPLFPQVHEAAHSRLRLLAEPRLTS